MLKIIGKESFNIFLVILSICFLALGGIFVKLSELGPVNTGLYRVLLSIPILIPFFLNERIKVKIKPKEILLILFSGVFLGFDLLLWNVSFFHTTVANANLLANLVPFTIIPISFFIYKEKIPRGFLFGVIITIIGVFLLIKGKNFESGYSLFGDSLAFLTSIFYGLFLSVVYKLRNKISAISIMFYSAFGTLIVLFPAAFIIEGISIPKEYSEWWPLISLAIFSQILGQGGLSYCLGKITSLLASVLVLTQPVISAIYAYFIFNEKISFIETIAILIVLFGIFWSKKTTK
ncbi:MULTISPECIES: DMT family transporter [Xenorhabdus]|uniref:DMT family transporter n=1 Tax=Xenorhabdus TaxID=626 RepID=UPI000649E848|nr:MULTISPECIES: DMT family transporter [Xenorhabdus]KLU14613.1 transporter [Xenorhabdus griffiniae]KOP32513.1 transporter [Xenorhabdus sp. GDc328]